MKRRVVNQRSTFNPSKKGRDAPETVTTHCVTMNAIVRRSTRQAQRRSNGARRPTPGAVRGTVAAPITPRRNRGAIICTSDEESGSENDESGDETARNNVGRVARMFDDEARGDDDDDNDDEEEPDDEDDAFIDDDDVEETGVRPRDEDVFGDVENDVRRDVTVEDGEFISLKFRAGN